MSHRTEAGGEKKGVCIGPPRLTRFERTRVIGARALQLTMSAPILVRVPAGVSNTIDIALKELEAGVLPMTVRRTLPDGSYQDIPLKWLLEGGSGSQKRNLKTSKRKSKDQYV